jgi:hypothetical protein
MSEFVLNSYLLYIFWKVNEAREAENLLPIQSWLPIFLTEFITQYLLFNVFFHKGKHLLKTVLMIQCCRLQLSCPVQSRLLYSVLYIFMSGTAENASSL